MNFVLKIKCDNAAFDPPENEIGRLLREAAAKVESGRLEGSLLDYNGNSVGSFEVKENKYD